MAGRFLERRGVLIVAFPVYLAFIASTHDAVTVVNGRMPLTPGSPVDVVARRQQRADLVREGDARLPRHAPCAVAGVAGRPALVELAERLAAARRLELTLEPVTHSGV